ncbi:MAG: DUF3493 domain-containing protein [Cyanobacteria bacterium P01_E01_bin.6]
MKRSQSSKINSSSKRSGKPPAGVDPELYARLQAEAKAPYRGLRQFIYVAFGASGLIGAFIFLAQLISGQGSQSLVGNFAIQVGVIALMVFLFRIDKAKS